MYDDVRVSEAMNYTLFVHMYVKRTHGRVTHIVFWDIDMRMLPLLLSIVVADCYLSNFINFYGVSIKK